jgi:hypothetical protein
MEERFPLQGDGDEFLVHGEKREAYTESVEEYFIPYMTIFFLLFGRG